MQLLHNFAIANKYNIFTLMKQKSEISKILSKLCLILHAYSELYQLARNTYVAIGLELI